MKKLLLSMVAMLGFTPAFAGSGTASDPYTVADVIAKGVDATESGVYVKGYIVGSCTGKAYDSATFEAGETASKSNFIIADNASCQDAAQCIPVQLPAGTLRDAINIQANPGNLKRLVTLGGDIAKYFGQPGFKNTSSYAFDGAVITPDPEPTGATLVLLSKTTKDTDWTLDTEWKWDSTNGYLKVSGYNKTLEADQWAVSPIINLTKVTEVKATFDQAAKFQTTLTTDVQFAVREAGSESWTVLPITTWPAEGGWTFVTSNEFNLSSYVGKKIQVGFKYAKACTDTWEVKNLTFTGNEGGEITVEAAPVPTTEVADIAAFLAAANTDGNTAIKGATTAVYQNGRYLWIKDNSGVLLCYNATDIEMSKFANGQTVDGGITGKYTNYSNGQLQMTNLVAGTFKAGAAGAEVEPEIMQIEEIGTDLVNTYILLKGVKVEATETANTYNVTDATGTMVLFNQFSNSKYYDVVEVMTGESLNVYAMVGIHSGAIQLYPVRVTTASGRDVVATPTFSVAPGAVSAGTQVTIACATEGATIYYTIDGSNPTAASQVYSTPVVVDKAMTLKALAVKAGMDDSSVATAEYTIKAVGPVTGNTATFNFADPESLDPAQKKPDPSTAIEVPGVEFTNNGISLVGNGGGTTVRLWPCGSEGHGVEYRVYNGGNITISASAAYVITKIEFAGAQLNALQYDGVAFTDNESNVFEPATPAASFKFDVVTNGKNKRADFSKITVTFADKAGVEDIELDNNAPVEFYNLQGVRMNGDLTPGLYIRRQGSKTAKVLVK